MTPRFDPDAAAVGEGIFGLPHTPEEAEVVLVPVPWEATVSHGSGTVRGPTAILEASRQIDLLDRETGRPYEHGIAMLPIPGEVLAWNEEARRTAAPVIAAGGPGEDPSLRDAVRRVDDLSEEMNRWVYETTRDWMTAGKLVGVVGGDHSTPFGSIRAAVERHPGVGILHLDAHSDLRHAFEGFAWSHASIMNNVFHHLPGVSRIVQIGIRDHCPEEAALIEQHPDRLRAFFDPDLRNRLLSGETWRNLAEEVVAALPDEVYLSFDIDGLDPALCPHTGTPVPGGLSFPEINLVLGRLAASGRRIVGFDLNEVAPDPTGESDWDGNVGARLVYKMIGFALLNRGSTAAGDTGGRSG